MKPNTRNIIRKTIKIGIEVSELKKEYEILTNKLKSDIEEYSQKKEFEKDLK